MVHVAGVLFETFIRFLPLMEFATEHSHDVPHKKLHSQKFVCEVNSLINNLSELITLYGYCERVYDKLVWTGSRQHRYHHKSSKISKCVNYDA